ncbi:hypothetical protein ASE33_03810 [Pseudomonas sp. Root9]|nr:hypothetical protein ASE33_03810 [Pseudomonas sp. Root9]
MIFSRRKKARSVGGLLFFGRSEWRWRIDLGHFKPHIDPAIRRNIHWRPPARHHLSVISERPALLEKTDYDSPAIGLLAFGYAQCTTSIRRVRILCAPALKCQAKASRHPILANAEALNNNAACFIVGHTPFAGGEKRFLLEVAALAGGHISDSQDG